MPPIKNTDKSSPESNSASDPPKQRKRPGRVPVSCAECRRLKLRCDRKVPCETCTKRGCAALCPDGALITGGKGTRQAVADVEDLKKKIEELTRRSGALENALRTLFAAVSDEPHPLLRDSASPNGAGPSASASDSPRTESSFEGPSLTADEEDALDAFGTLTLGPRGETRFFGQTSRSEYLIHAPERVRVHETLKLPRMSKEMIDEANKELDVPCQNIDIGAEILNFLPPLSQACALSERFLEYGAYLWYPLPRRYVFDDIVALAYQTWKHKCNIATTHQLALMWMIFALGTLFDLDSPPSAAEAHEYYLLARLSLRFAPPAHDTTLTSIQTMIYMAQYLEMSDCEPAHSQSHKAWMVVGHAVKLGHSIGLHMNSERWHLDVEARAQRDRVFWQLFFLDSWLSFGFGRPPSINLAFVDCEIPKEPEVACGDTEKGSDLVFHIWTWQYTKLLHTITTTAFASRAPTYPKVMELDRRVRDFPVPEVLRITYATLEAPCIDVTQTAMSQRLLGTLLKETTLLNLHRAYFSQALNGKPFDPLKHKYGPSVMAIYRSAWRIIAMARCSFQLFPGVVGRLNLLWSYALASAIVMCLVVIRAPLTSLAKSSLAELDKLCELFEEATTKGSQLASNNVDVVRRMRKQAHDAINKVQATEDTLRMHDELDRLGGKTQLICPDPEQPPEARGCAARRRTAADAVGTTDGAQTNGTGAHAHGACEPLVQPDMIHPTIVQDMRAFDVDAALAGVADPSHLGQVDLTTDFPSAAFDPHHADFTLFPEFDFSGLGVGMLSPGSAGSGASAVGMGATPGASSSGSGATPDVWMNGQGPPPPSQAAVPSGLPAGFELNGNGPPVLDATWQAFVEQLGF